VPAVWLPHRPPASNANRLTDRKTIKIRKKSRKQKATKNNKISLSAATKTKTLRLATYNLLNSILAGSTPVNI